MFHLKLVLADDLTTTGADRASFDVNMLDVRVLIADALFQAIHRLFHFHGRQLLVELDIHREQDRMRTEMHRQWLQHIFYTRIRFRQLLDTL